MRTELVLMLLLIPAAELLGVDRVLQPVDWSQALQSSAASVDALGVLTLSHLEPDGKTFPLATAEGPPTEVPRFGFVGEISYSDVVGTGYLEVLAHFDRGTFFSRTLADVGPLQCVTGSSDWRPFSIPFFVSDLSYGRPRRVDLQLVLGGCGTARLRNVKFVEFAQHPGRDSALGSAAWWRDSTGGLGGGLVGALLGILGALVGVLTAVGRGRAGVLATLFLMTVLGAGSLILGLVAVLSHQPYSVYYPCLIIGVLGVGLPLSLLRGVRRRFTELELRRMQALDLR